MKKFFLFVSILVALTVFYSCHSNNSTDQSSPQNNGVVIETVECVDSCQNSVPEADTQVRYIDSLASFKPVEMQTLSDTYYELEELPNGKVKNPTLDKIPGLAHYEFNNKAYSDYSNEDGTRFDMMAEVYMDTEYPSAEIQSFLFKEIDQKLFYGFACDWLEGDSLYWAEAKPYQSPDAKSFIESWKPVFKKLTHSQYEDKHIKYFDIINSLSFVLCHKVFEDENVVTYVVESGNSSHGGCGCRNAMDYYSFDKSNGKLLGIKDFVNASNIDKITKALNEAYALEYSQGMGGTPVQTLSITDANGVALLNEGILFYFLPYTIGCGAEGQYNLVLDKNP